MTRIARTWPADAFDSIGIKAHQGKFIIQGTEGNEVKLDGDLAARYSRNLELGPVGRWLKIYTSWQFGESQFTLQLPKSKIWTIDLFSGRAEVKVDNINARLHLWLGKGEAQIDNCRGAFSLTSGNADVRLKHFVETEAAEIPPLPPAPNPATGWNSGPYLMTWSEEVSAFLLTHANRMDDVPIPSDRPVNVLETASLTVFEGMR